LAFVSSERTDDTKAKRKGKIIQRPKEKDRSYKGQKKRTDDAKATGKGQMI
jgi:hypothetical protein